MISVRKSKFLCTANFDLSIIDMIQHQDQEFWMFQFKNKFKNAPIFKFKHDLVWNLKKQSV